MSGPISTEDAPAEPCANHPDPPEVEIFAGRNARVGAFEVNRVLPRRARRTVGAWCFVDHMGPGSVTNQQGLDIGPHPHIGLQTVTWLFQGEILHRDTLGSEQVIRPGQLNLMTAGHGVAHSEETRGLYEGEIHGVQFWVAQPESTRNGRAEFEHHAELPRMELTNGDATVLVGQLGTTASPARRDTDHVGVDLNLGTGLATLPLNRAHEYGLTVIEGAVAVNGQELLPGEFGYLGTGRDELGLTTKSPARAILVGGEPFAEEILMWWNYVGRTRDEISVAHQSWIQDDRRYGTVASPLDRIIAGDPPWVSPR